MVYFVRKSSRHVVRFPDITMLKFLSILLVLIIKALASDISDVVTLTPANFDDVVNGDANVLVEFYARKHSLRYTLPSASSNTFIFI